MNAQAILERIESDAKDAASAIVNDAKERVAALNAQAEDKLSVMRDDTQKKAALEGEELEQRMYRMDELENRKLLLSAKRAQIDRAFDMALAKLKAMPSEQAAAFFKSVVLPLCEGTEEIVIGSDNEKWFSEEFVSDLNKALVANGKKGELKWNGQKRSQVTGIILSRDEAEIDCTFEALVKSSRMEMEQEVAGILFS